MSKLKIVSAEEAREIARGMASSQEILIAISGEIAEMSRHGHMSLVVQSHGFENIEFHYARTGFGNAGVHWSTLCPTHQEVVKCLEDAGYDVHLCITNSMHGHTGLHVSWQKQRQR